MLFAVLWETLDEVMGSATTATLVRRAVKHASSRSAGFEGLLIVRERFAYRYSVPDSWKSETPDGLTSLQELTRELQPLLVELTGSVVLHRLRGVPQLRRCGLFHPGMDQ